MILHSKIMGEQPKNLVILHGLFGQSDNWGTLGKRFAEHFTVHLVDLRNHGRSFHSNEMSFDLMNQDLCDYVDHYSLNNLTILGHSLGGKVAMEFALSNHESLDKLIVADIAPKAYPPHHQSIIYGLQSLNFNQIQSRKHADEELAKYIPEFGTRQFLLKNLYWKEKEKMAFRFNLDSIAKNYEDLIGSAQNEMVFNQPTLFLKGEKSDYILPEDEALIGRNFPDFKVISIEKAGHWLHAENPNAVFEQVKNFVFD